MYNLIDFYEWFHNYYRKFYSSDPVIMGMVRFKENHSIRVAKYSRDLAQAIGLSMEKVDLAEIIGLLHDIARSEQAHFKSFKDSLSFDHGDRGVLRLEEAGVLDALDCKSKRIVLFSVKYHNKMTVPGTDSDNILFARIIRDADKLDIFRNLPPIQAEHNYSPALVELLRAGRALPYSEVKTVADKRLIGLGWFYDLNYRWTLTQIVDEGYAEELLSSLPDNPPFNEIKDDFRAYVKENKTGSVIGLVKGRFLGR